MTTSHLRYALASLGVSVRAVSRGCSHCLTVARLAAGLAPAKEIRWGLKVSALTGGSHFMVNSADNGHGPLLSPQPGRQGIEDLCNPPGRGAGIPTTTDTGNPAIDAFMWVHVPGTSSGRCNGGRPAGTFWLAPVALTEARNANARLGPRYQSRPY